MDDSVVKNMVFSLSDLKKKIEKFLVFCKENKMELKTSKFVISEGDKDYFQ